MQPLPEYDELGHEKLSYENSWRADDPQTVEGADCFAPFASINNGLNRLVLDLTGDEITEMLSALYIGAEFVYPSHYLQIVSNFLKAIHCPVDFEEECQEYPTYTPIIQYSPMNPFMNPDEVPEGYLVPPFVFVSEDNIAEYGDYEIGDVIVPIDAITLDLDWFETLEGQLPTITVNVEGEGKISLKLLTVPFGGVAVIALDNPPDLIDILAGVITGSDNILDVNRDIVSIPPETTEHVSYELEVTGAGLHTIYIVFLPVLDDSLIPVRFGGGLRSIELCDFGEFPMGYVEDVRWNDDEYMLEQKKNGVYEPVTDFDIFMTYFSAVETTAYDAQTRVGEAEAQIITIFDDLTGINVRLDGHDADILAIETLQATHDTSIANLATRMEAAEDAIDAIDALDARLDALENVAMWVETWDFEDDDFGIIPLNATYTGGIGFVHTGGTGDVTLQSIGGFFAENQIDTLEIGYSYQSGNTGAPTNVPEHNANGTPYGSINFTGNGGTGKGFYRMKNNPSASIEVAIQDFGSFTVKYIKFYGRGNNPF